MEPLNEMEILNKAIMLYIGVGVLPYPKEDEGRLLDNYGEEAGRLVLRNVQAVISDLQAIEVDWDKHDLVGGSKWAVAKLRLGHVDLSDDAGSALEWLYSWWWK